MSYILEALKKADQERSRGAVPDIRASHLVMHEGRDYRRIALALMILFLAVQALLLFLYLHAEPAAPPVPVATTAAAPPTASLAPITPPAAPLAASREPASPIVLAPPSAAREIAPARAAPAPAAQARPAADEVPVYSINPWQQGSAAVQQLAVGLSLDVHVYAEQPAQRFVLINMIRYREGERLKEGALLERITPQGVVLSYEGEPFRYDRP